MFANNGEIRAQFMMHTTQSKPISYLSACAKQWTGNTGENIDTHKVINMVRMQKFPTEECTPSRVAGNHKSVCITRAFDRKVDSKADD